MQPEGMEWKHKCMINFGLDHIRNVVQVFVRGRIATFSTNGFPECFVKSSCTRAGCAKMQNKKKDQLLKAPINSSVGRCKSTRVDEGRKCRIILAIKMKARTVVGKGEEGPLGHPRFQVLLGGSARAVRGHEWDEEK